MLLRTALNAFFKSRQKILIKRRKIQFKNRPLSNKRLKQEREQINAAYETKMLNIRKEMDRTQSPNLHINEIVEELFYPELSFNNQEEVDQRVRQVSNDALEKEAEWESLVQMDSIATELHQNSLPLELLETHQKRGELFSAEHYAVLMQRMNYYVFHIEAIKKKRMENWARMTKSLKTKGNKSQQIKCPYLFLQREQIARHQLWQNMIEKMRLKIQQEKDIAVVNQYIRSLLLIHQTFYYIPADLYQALLNKNAAAPFKLLTTRNISDLLHLMKFRNKLKFNPSIKIDTPQENSPKQQNHLSLGRKLASAVIDNPKEYTADDLSNIFKIINIRKNKMHILQPHQFKLIEEIITPLLTELPFEAVETFFVVYCSFNQKNNRQFSEIIKYDLYRKADQCQNYFYIYDLITRIKGRSLSFRVYMPKGINAKQFRLQAYDLLVRLSHVITKMIDKLRSQEVVQLLATYYDNDIRDQSVIEIISTEIVKRGSELELQVLGKSLFQLTVLGHSSKILTKYVLQEFDKRYHNEMKKYREEGVFLLPTQQKVTPITMNFKQIYLQQCLLMVLWSITKQMGNRLQKQLDLMKLLDLIPVKIESGDPLAMQLTININAALKPLGMFPKIMFPTFNTGTFPMGRFKELYCRDYSRDKVDLLMAEQAKQSKIFIENYNPKDNLFLAERWSAQNTYSRQAYIDFCLKSNNIQPQTKGHCFYDATIQLHTKFLQKRQGVISSLASHLAKEEIKDPKIETKQTKTKVYDLLL